MFLNDDLRRVCMPRAFECAFPSFLRGDFLQRFSLPRIHQTDFFNARLSEPLFLSGYGNLAAALHVVHWICSKERSPGTTTGDKRSSSMMVGKMLSGEAVNPCIG